MWMRRRFLCGTPEEVCVFPPARPAVKMKISVEYLGIREQLEVEPGYTAELLRVQIFSIFGAPSDRQEWRYAGRFLSGTDLSEQTLDDLGINDGCVIQLGVPAPPQPTDPANAPASELAEAKDVCTRSFFGTSPLCQPCVLADGKPVCVACAMMCRQNSAISQECRGPFVCQCREVGECLFQERNECDTMAAVFYASLKSSLDLDAHKQRDVQLLPAKRRLASRLRSYAEMRMSYESEAMQETARSVIPLDELRAAAEADPDPTLAPSDKLVKQLLHWFKRTFRWVNEPPCDHCGASTKRLGADRPTADEQRYGAGITELYQCSTCALITRFPRYNHAGKIMQTRRGRCGEFAQAFCLCCRSLGMHVRLILDWTDHVWVEVYSEAQRRWVHCDCCEDTYDAPLMYESGWGKKLSYILAFSEDGIADVTRRYTRRYPEVLARRTEILEEGLCDLLADVDSRLKARLSPAQCAAARERDRQEAEELEASLHPLAPAGACPHSDGEASHDDSQRQLKPEETAGRLSGTADGPKIE
ncbi:putative Protein png1 [Paratrimastix pyriformis]|uniref:Ubiquitin-like domain-containing protein n=1 Tax=Paratrimastix pyriformis TaxID=342808 RepID=A0ABQ8U7J8_9EUKA|nr:putative Protein png1 [Paratrimastix pyriformis]